MQLPLFLTEREQAERHRAALEPPILLMLQTVPLHAKADIRPVVRQLYALGQPWLGSLATRIPPLVAQLWWWKTEREQAEWHRAALALRVLLLLQAVRWNALLDLRPVMRQLHALLDPP